MELGSFGYGDKKFSSPEEELAFLRAQILQKERELQSRGIAPEREPLIKEHLEGYKAVPAMDVLAEGHRLKSDESHALAQELLGVHGDPTMNQLLGIVNEKGIKNALDVVAKMGNAHKEDDFHQMLIHYIKNGMVIDGMKEKTQLHRSLHMTLFEVVLPASKDEEVRNKSLKDLVSAMGQFYAGMLSVSSSGHGSHQYFVIEIALAHIGQEISFYCAVEDSRRDLFMKQILAVFPKATINEKKDDYNVFNEEGYSVGSYAIRNNKSIFPIKTYDHFEHDPLSVILNAFSKLANEGEGAAIQCIVRADDSDYAGKYRDALRRIEKGTPVKEAIDIPLTLAGELFQTAKDILSTSPKKADGTPGGDTGESKQRAVEQIREKTSSPITRSNLRIVVSAPDKNRAESMMDVFESTFSQFENTEGNKIAFARVPERKRQHFFHDYSFRLFSERQELPLSLKELTSLIHFPVREGSDQQELREEKANTAPAPFGLAQEGVILGINKYRGTEIPIYMTPQDRIRHLYVIGQTGTGKSTLLTNLINQDIKNGDGCCFIDPHGSDVQHILENVPKERYEDVIYFDPSYAPRPMALNMLEYDTRYPEQKTFVVNEMLGIFNKLFDMKTAGGPMFEQYFRNSVMLVMDDPESGNTLLDVSRVLADEAYRKLKLSRCKNPIVKQYWEEVALKAGGEASLQNIVPYITSKFDVFLSNDIMRPIVAQEQSSFNFRKVMDEKKILLVNLSKGRLGDINANLIGLILVGKILMAALSRVDSLSKDFPPFYLYIDEFQNVTTDSISTILSEARKYKLSLNVAHQFIAQLDEGIKNAVFGNVGSMCVYRVGSDDAEYLEKQFTPVFTAKDIMNIDNYNAYLKLLSKGIPVKPFSVAALPPPHGNKDQLDSLKQLSYLKFGQDRALVEAEIMKKYEMGKPKAPDPLGAKPRPTLGSDTPGAQPRSPLPPPPPLRPTLPPTPVPAPEPPPSIQSPQASPLPPPQALG